MEKLKKLATIIAMMGAVTAMAWDDPPIFQPTPPFSNDNFNAAISIGVEAKMSFWSS